MPKKEHYELFQVDSAAKMARIKVSRLTHQCKVVRDAFAKYMSRGFGINSPVARFTFGSVCASTLAELRS
jgi:hypothetical protein